MPQMTKEELEGALELLEDTIIKNEIVEVLKDRLCIISCSSCQNNIESEDSNCSGCVLNWSISNEYCNAIASEVIKRLRK